MGCVYTVGEVCGMSYHCKEKEAKRNKRKTAFVKLWIMPLMWKMWKSQFLRKAYDCYSLLLFEVNLKLVLPLGLPHCRTIAWKTLRPPNIMAAYGFPTLPTTRLLRIRFAKKPWGKKFPQTPFFVAFGDMYGDMFFVFKWQNA